MKILYFLTSINTGGAEKFCVDLCNTQGFLSDTEIYLCVLDSLGSDQPLIEQISDNVKLISLNKKGGYSLKIISKIHKLLKELRPDFIHINGRALIYASLPILLTRIPSIYTVHTLAHKEYNKYFRGYIKLLFTRFPKLFSPVAISHTVLSTIKETYGKQYNEVIYNGSSVLKTTPLLDSVKTYIESFKKNKETLVFCYIGRIAPEKNTLLLIETFNYLLDKNENIVLCVIGYDTTSKQDYFPKCKEQNKHPDKIKFLGRKENIADYLYYADANCMTSSYEGLGITALEAFSMGVPVLSTPSGGPSDIIISGINGYVSKHITVNSYLSIVEDFIKKPLIDKDVIKKIYKENYTMSICAKKYLNLYQNRKAKMKLCV